MKLPSAAGRSIFYGVCGWLMVIFFLTYKQKVRGEAAVRPIYMLGLAIAGWMALYYAAGVFRRCRFTYGARDEGLLALLLLALLGFLTLQGLVHRDSLNALLYCLTTVFLVYACGVFSVLHFGRDRFLLMLTAALTAYSLANFLLLLLGIYSPATFGLIQLSGAESGYGTRLSGFLGDPTHLGTLLSLTLLMLFLFARQLSASWLAPLALLLAMGTVFAGSRNSLLSLALGCAASVALERKLSRRAMRVLLGAAMILIAAALLLTLNDGVYMFVRTMLRLDDPNAYSRVEIWVDMLGILARMPVFEIVIGGGFQFIQGIYGSPYNAFLRILFDHGLIVLLLVLACVVLVATLILTERDVLTRKAAGALFVYWLSFSMYLDTFFAEFFHLGEFCFWLAAALVTSRAFTSLPRGQPEFVAVATGNR